MGRFIVGLQVSGGHVDIGLPSNLIGRRSGYGVPNGSLAFQN